MKKTLSFILEIIKIVVIALAIVLPIRYFLFQPFIVKGQSMEPNFFNGDYLIIDEISYKLRPPERGEIIVFKSPIDSNSRYIKRIIGLPRETVEIKNSEIFIYDSQSNCTPEKFNCLPVSLDESGYLPEDIKTLGNTTISLGENEYFVLGDNRFASYDSRRFGPIPKENIIGRVYLRAWPFNELTQIKVPNY